MYTDSRCITSCWLIKVVAMDSFDITDYVFALTGVDVYHDEDVDDSRAWPRQVYGTTFYLKNNIFMTAGHSIEYALRGEHSVLGLVYLAHFVAGRAYVCKVADYEIVADYDVGFVKVKDEISQAKALVWDFNKLNILDEIRTTGFPHALDHYQKRFMIRAFQGYIVSCTEFRELEARPLCYELSFPCPKGLSGAPLFTREPEPTIRGVVIKSSSMAMEVFSEKETIGEGTHTLHEAYFLGLGLTTGSLQNIESKILGCSLEEHLKRVDLL